MIKWDLFQRLEDSFNPQIDQHDIPHLQNEG